MSAPAATACVSSAGVLPGPAKLTCSAGHRRVERDAQLAGRGGVERVDEPGQVLHDGRHRVRLDRVAELHVGGERRAQQRDALGDRAAVVREERRRADARGESLEVDPADGVAGDGRRVVVDGAHAATSSPRSSARSNLPFGERGDLAAHGHVARDHVAGKLLGQHARAARPGRRPRRRRAHDERDGLADALVLDAEGDRVAHEAGVVHGLLDLGRADAVAGRLDHLVLAADEVEEALLVGDDDVARVHRHLRRAQRAVAARRGLEALRRALRVVPVAERHERAAVHELALLTGLAARAVLAHDEDLRTRDRLADRVGPAVDLRGIEVRGAERLGEAVHEERLRGREESRAAVERRARHAAAGVGEVAQRAGRLRRPGQVGELDPQRRHAGQAGHAVLRAEPARCRAAAGSSRARRARRRGRRS